MSVLRACRVQFVAAIFASGGIVCFSSVRAQAAEPTAATQPMMATTSPAATAPAVSADPSTPRGALKSLVGAMAAGDSEKIKQLISTTNPTEDKMVSAMANMSVSERRFRTAAETAFGPKAKELTGDVDAGTADGLAKIDASRETVTGDNASIDGAGPEGSPPLKLTRVGSDWHIPIGELSRGVDPATVNQRLEDLSFMSKMMDESADEVAKGTYKTPRDAGEAIKSKMMVAMMKHAATATQPATQLATQPAMSPASEPPPATAERSGVK